jgi:hypothetical protein
MDGSSLAVVESAALTQGVAFMYKQAGELLTRRRQARDRAAASAERQAGGHSPAPGPAPLAPLQLPEEVFEPVGSIPMAPAPAVLERLAQSLLGAYRDLDDYVLGTAALGGESQVGLDAVDRLRRLLEEVYGTAVTFRGEQRRPGGGTATHVTVQQGGISLGGNVHVTGDIAGRDIVKNS